MNADTIVIIEKLFATLNLDTAEDTKLAAVELCGELGDETGDVLQELLERCYGSCHLMEYLWEASEEGAEYDCTAEDIKKFLQLRMSEGHFDAFALPEDILVSHDNVDGWVDSFKNYLES